MSEEEGTGSSIEDDPNSTFCAEFADAHTLRNMIDYIKSGTPQYFVFSKRGITYKWPNDTRTVLNVISIKAKELVSYSCVSNTGYIYVGLDLMALATITKTFKRSDSAVLYKKPEDDKVYIKVIGKGAAHNVSYVRMIPASNYVEYTTGDPVDKYNPTCVVSTNEFATMCNGIGQSKCDFVKIVKHNAKVEFIVDVGSGSSARVYPLGSGNDEKDLDVLTCKDEYSKQFVVKGYNFKVATTILKSLSKLHALSPYGTVQIHAPRETTGDTMSPITFLTQIGSFGKICVLVKLLADDG